MSDAKAIDFSDLEEPLGSSGAAPDQAEVLALRVKQAAEILPGLYEETCRKCRGSGRFVGYSGRSLGECFKCKGKGKLTFKTDAASRAKGRVSAAATKAKKAATALEKFAEAHPAAWAWIAESKDNFAFAADMHAAIERFGDLTPNQLAACERAVAKRAAAAEEKKARVANAPVVDIGKIEEAFAAAKGSKLGNPKLRLAEFVFSPAKATSANAGAIYVKKDGEYLGKVMGGKFLGVRDLDPALAAKVIEVASKPAEAAVAYGRMMGSCACCGRTLTDPESVARGIGPICAENFGWGG